MVAIEDTALVQVWGLSACSAPWLPSASPPHHEMSETMGKGISVQGMQE